MQTIAQRDPLDQAGRFQRMLARATRAARAAERDGDMATARSLRADAGRYQQALQQLRTWEIVAQ